MGTLTITTTAPQDARLVTAYGSILGLGRNATAAEIKAAVIQSIRNNVENYERSVAPPFVFTPLDPT